MPNSDDQREGALKSLGDQLGSLEASRARKSGELGSETRAAGDGYRLLGELIGGVLGGLGFGWALDHYAHTAPWGMIGGLLIGLGVSVFMIVRQATRMSVKAAKEQGPAQSVPFEDDDD